MGNGQWAMGNGQWAMGNGQWTMGNGQWAGKKPSEQQRAETSERAALSQTRITAPRPGPLGRHLDAVVGSVRDVGQRPARVRDGLDIGGEQQARQQRQRGPHQLRG